MRFFRRRREDPAAPQPAEGGADFPRRLPPNELEPRLTSPHIGPSWMAPEEWNERLAAYQRQGRASAQIREVADHLERRGPPPSRGERITRAKSRGYVARDEFLSAEDEAAALA